MYVSLNKGITVTIKTNTIKEFKFKVTQTEVYTTIITVVAENEEEAEIMVDEELDDCPIDVRSNTLNSIDLDKELIN